MTKYYFKVFLLSFFLSFFFLINQSEARENVTDWYVKNFSSEIIVNKDSSLDITETITADCGTGIDKHGIFRILPESTKVTGKGTIKTPIELVSIKDLNGNDYNYTTVKNIADNTITWKIGDANKTVQGENIYVIKYKVKNAIRFFDKNFDELYWNLTGNFWDLEIDEANIKIIFPKEVNKETATVSLYSGFLGDKGNQSADFQWKTDNVLAIDSSEKLLVRQGITIAVTFPKGIVNPYEPSFLEKYGKYLLLFIPFLVFLICFRIWKKYGDDPSFNKTIIPEYEAPKDMSLVELGLLMTNGTFKNHFITAEIINFAVQKILTIKESEDKVLFLKKKNYKFIRSRNSEAENKLNEVQKIILNKIFEKEDEIKLSSLKNNFYKILGDLRKTGNKLLGNKNLIVDKGVKYNTIFIPIGFILFFVGFFYFSSVFGWGFGVSLGVSGIIVLIFGFIMPKRTLIGAEMNWRAKGFKLFMETVDKDRAKFYEEENIFEKFLPYAILFEITEEWIKRIKEIYGEEYFTNHIPAWYVGSNLESFNVDNFNSALSDLSSSIAANTSSPSGSGGGGSSGGGGGGGGGGGW